MVNNIASQIENALNSGEFEYAYRLFSQYGRALEAQLDKTASSLDRDGSVQQALEMMKRWLTLARVMRSHLTDTLRQTACEHSYSTGGPAQTIVQFVG